MTEKKNKIDEVGLITSLKELVKISNKNLESLNNQSIEYEYQRILFYLLQRFHVNIRILTLTLEWHVKNSKYNFTIASLIRPLLSDYILMLHLTEVLRFDSKTLKPDDKEFLERYQKVSYSYFERLEAQIKDEMSEGKMTREEREEFMKKEKEFYPEFFEDTRVPKLKKQKAENQPKTLIRKLKSGHFRKLTLVYQVYFYYSQFEHFSKKTEELLETDRQGAIKMLLYALDFVLRGVLMMVAFIEPTNSNKIEPFNTYLKDFDEKFLRYGSQHQL